MHDARETVWRPAQDLWVALGEPAIELANDTHARDTSLDGVRDAVMADAAMRFESFGPLIPPDRVVAAVEAGFEVWSFQYAADDGEGDFTTIETDDLDTVRQSLVGGGSPQDLADALESWWGPFRLGNEPYRPIAFGEPAPDCPICDHTLNVHNGHGGCVATIPGVGYCPCTYRDSREDS